jgi:hypothetical protein
VSDVGKIEVGSVQAARTRVQSHRAVLQEVDVDQGRLNGNGATIKSRIDARSPLATVEKSGEAKGRRCLRLSILLQRRGSDMNRVLIVLALVLAPAAAFADKQAAATCAGSLQPGAKAIFDATMANLGSGQKALDVMKAQVTQLVKAGTVQKSSARADAKAAGDCLKLLKS